MTADYAVENHGSIFIVQPQTAEARAHLEAHVSAEAQWFAGGVAVEHRYIVDLVAQLQDDGFEVS
jgi:hypothetical protein